MSKAVALLKIFTMLRVTKMHPFGNLLSFCALWSETFYPNAGISLACKFLATVIKIKSRTFGTTFARVSHECPENFHVSRTSCALVAMVLNMFKSLFAKICHKTVVRQSYNVRASVANLSPQIFDEFIM